MVHLLAVKVVQENDSLCSLCSLCMIHLQKTIHCVHYTMNCFLFTMMNTMNCFCVHCEWIVFVFNELFLCSLWIHSCIYHFNCVHNWNGRCRSGLFCYKKMIHCLQKIQKKKSKKIRWNASPTLSIFQFFHLRFRLLKNILKW